MSKYVLFPCLLLLALLTACGTDQTTTIAPATVQSTHATTPAPTQKTTTNTLTATSGPALLGSPLSAFVGRYGQPNSHTDAKSGAYHLQRYSGSNTDFLILQTDVFDKGYTDKVEGITVQSSDNSATPPITAATCVSFMPLDAKYQRQTQLTTGSGYDKIYSSASLARAFPASAFTDATNTQTRAGLFDVQYLTHSDGSIDSCNIQVGTQQAQ